MAFLDDIDKKITLWGQGAIQKTKEVSDTAKLTNAIRVLESEKKDYFAEIGRTYYAECVDKGLICNEEFENLVKQYLEAIHRIEIEIQEKQEQITQIKGVIYCTRCNAEIPQNSVFCNNCGTKVEHKIKVSNTKKCVTCGAQLEDNQLFCSNCGTKVEKQDNCCQVEKTEEKRCIQCGAPLKDTQSFCTSCGTKVQVEIIENSVIITNRICPNCGVELEEDQRFCVECGYKL